VANRVARWQRLGDVLFDALFVYLGIGLAYLLRYTYGVGGEVLRRDYEPFSTFQRPALALIALTLCAIFLRGGYRLSRSTGLLDQGLLLAGAVTTSVGGLVLFAYLLKFSPSRLVFIYAWAIIIVLLWLRRLASKSLQSWLWARGVGVIRVLVVGSNETSRRVMQALANQPGLGYALVGFVDDDVSPEPLGIGSERRVIWLNRLGSLRDIEPVVAGYGVDEVIITMPASSQHQVLSIIDQCRQQAVTFKVVPDLLQLSLDRVDLGEVAGMPLIGLKDASITGWNYSLKRTLDVVIALGVLTISALPMAIIALLIKRGSPGPVLFRQQRIGRNGVPFTITKFRCMVADAEEQRQALIASQGDSVDSRLFKMRDDPRLTPIGRWLRRWSLDELPQFFQVLKGQMSFVGPRPQLMEEVRSYEDWHRQRLLITPGMTGLWQINGRSDLSFDEMVRLDLYYAEHWSLWLDIKIILRTIPAVVFGRGAY
jgi:exopolysaccharide biosynthesis polyprenyl glycosylphosphotransferase